jgi:hypothetical protein
MSRDEIAETSYDAALELASIEYECGRITEEAYNDRTKRTETARMLLRRIDDILLIKDADERERELWKIKEEGESLMRSTVCNKNDLDWATGSIWSNAPRVVTGLIKNTFKRK